MRWKLFYIGSNGITKNSSFHTDFKNVHMTFVKNAHKKPIFLAKTFFGCTFSKVLCTFLKSLRKDGFFDAPFDLFKEKKFSSHRRDNELFWELKRSKMEETAKNFEKTVFYKQILDFHCPSKILCHTSKLWKITGPYCVGMSWGTWRVSCEGRSKSWGSFRTSTTRSSSYSSRRAMMLTRFLCDL